MFLAPRTPVQSPQVYTAGTYVANFGRSPSEPANFRPTQFSFLPQPDYGTAREPSDPGVPDTNGGQPDVTRPIPSQPVVSSPQNQLKSGEALRTFTFEAPMRPLDVARNMYLYIIQPLNPLTSTIKDVRSYQVTHSMERCS